MCEGPPGVSWQDYLFAKFIPWAASIAYDLNQFPSSCYVMHHPRLSLILAIGASLHGNGVIVSHTFPNGSQNLVLFVSESLVQAQEMKSQFNKEARDIIFGLRKLFIFLGIHDGVGVVLGRPQRAELHVCSMLCAVSQKWIHAKCFAGTEEWDAKCDCGMEYCDLLTVALSRYDNCIEESVTASLQQDLVLANRYVNKSEELIKQQKDDDLTNECNENTLATFV
ncbi:uncharacterized protein LOC126471179 [Schistocerca serialis cubense]|uniref:uncharacterized protein LOC126471179 n=1 Tax=Schistocerca serialis cubense TaxID=2023355 RepID=UPI00214E0571|nr:uncharacterized protein LOC126471179 [Schistocerca serialis cubense]